MAAYPRQPGFTNLPAYDEAQQPQVIAYPTPTAVITPGASEQQSQTLKNIFKWKCFISLASAAGSIGLVALVYGILNLYGLHLNNFELGVGLVAFGGVMFALSIPSCVVAVYFLNAYRSQRSEAAIQQQVRGPNPYGTQFATYTTNTQSPPSGN